MHFDQRGSDGALVLPFLGCVKVFPAKFYSYIFKRNDAHKIWTNLHKLFDIIGITLWGLILSSSRTSVRVKLGLFNAKIRNENRRYIHRLIYQINEQDLLCHSI